MKFFHFSEVFVFFFFLRIVLKSNLVRSALSFTFTYASYSAAAVCSAARATVVNGTVQLADASIRQVQLHRTKRNDIVVGSQTRRSGLVHFEYGNNLDRSVFRGVFYLLKTAPRRKNQLINVSNTEIHRQDNREI